MLGLVDVQEPAAREVKLHGDIDTRARTEPTTTPSPAGDVGGIAVFRASPARSTGLPRLVPVSRIARARSRAPGGKPPQTTTRHPDVATSSAAAAESTPSITIDGSAPSSGSMSLHQTRAVFAAVAHEADRLRRVSRRSWPMVSASSCASVARSGTNRRQSSAASPGIEASDIHGDALTGDKLMVGTPASASTRATSCGSCQNGADEGQHVRGVGRHLAGHPDGGCRLCSCIELDHLDGDASSLDDPSLHHGVER